MIYTRKIKNLWNFEILKFAIFRNYKIWGMFRIFQNKNFVIFQIANFSNFPN